jgi:hypothetical protein
MLIFYFKYKSFLRNIFIFSLFFIDVFYSCIVSCKEKCHRIKKIFRCVDFNSIIEKISEKKYNKRLQNNIVLINRDKNKSLENISEDLRVRTKIYKKENENLFFNDNLERINIIFNNNPNNKDFFTKLNNKCKNKYNNLLKSISYILYIKFALNGDDKNTIIRNIKSILSENKFFKYNFKFNEFSFDLKKQIENLKKDLNYNPFIIKFTKREKIIYYVCFLINQQEFLFININKEKSLSENDFINKYNNNKVIKKPAFLSLKDILNVIFK